MLNLRAELRIYFEFLIEAVYFCAQPQNVFHLTEISRSPKNTG
jgi:hypothetical protein